MYEISQFFEIFNLVVLTFKNLKRKILCKTDIVQRKKQNVQKILQHYQVLWL